MHHSQHGLGLYAKYMQCSELSEAGSELASAESLAHPCMGPSPPLDGRLTAWSVPFLLTPLAMRPP